MTSRISIQQHAIVARRLEEIDQALWDIMAITEPVYGASDQCNRILWRALSLVLTFKHQMDLKCIREGHLSCQGTPYYPREGDHV